MQGYPMKKILILLGATVLVATGCQSTNDAGNPAPAVSPGAPHFYPPSPNTMNNPPAAVAPPAPPALH
jgi:hypothetical protein